MYYILYKNKIEVFRTLNAHLAGEKFTRDFKQNLSTRSMDPATIRDDINIVTIRLLPQCS